MLAYQEAVSLAQMAGQWLEHPSRAEQQIALVRGVEHVWDECHVPLHWRRVRLPVCSLPMRSVLESRCGWPKGDIPGRKKASIEGPCLVISA
jgi:hypothetical protein